MKKFDISKCTIEEILSIKSECENFIYNYEDGYVYICKVRSYGRNWVEEVRNIYELENLCRRYDGEDGIVDVYSNNPKLGGIFYNYGSTMYIRSREDYENWNKYQLLTYNIKHIEDQLKEWDNKDNVPFKQRPMWEPTYTKSDLEELKKEAEEYNMSFVAPAIYGMENKDNSNSPI